MSDVTVTLPDEAAQALHVPPEQLEAEVRLAAAMKLFEIGRLSSGAAANLAGLPRVVFLTHLSDYGVPTFRLTEEELREEAGVG
jgi:predicted HTH domain antitoxin